MFQLDEDAEYTYSEADSVTYPDDIQVAINRGWFELSGNNFMPEQAVTTAEADAMLADAAEVIAGDIIDENHENTYEFAEGVIEVPETANATIDENNTVTITDYDAQISEGDTFVVYAMGIPVVLKAVTVERTDNMTTITAEKESAEDVLVSMESEGVSKIDVTNFVPNEVSTYSIVNTASNSQREDLIFELASLTYDNDKLIGTEKISVGSAAAGAITFELSNMDLKHDASLLRQTAEVSIVGDASITTNVDFDFGDYAGIPSSITLGYVNILGIGSISLSAEYSLKGGMSMTWTGDLEAGFLIIAVTFV